MGNCQQMSIFDLIPKKQIDQLSETEMVEIVKAATGLNFQYKDELYGYVTNIGKVSFDIKYSYFSDNHEKFISCGYSRRGGDCYGCHAPIGTVDEAITFLGKE